MRRFSFFNQILSNLFSVSNISYDSISF